MPTYYAGQEIDMSGTPPRPQVKTYDPEVFDYAAGIQSQTARAVRVKPSDSVGSLYDILTYASDDGRRWSAEIPKDKLNVLQGILVPNVDGTTLTKVENCYGGIYVGEIVISGSHCGGFGQNMAVVLSEGKNGSVVVTPASLTGPFYSSPNTIETERYAGRLNELVEAGAFGLIPDSSPAAKKFDSLAFTNSELQRLTSARQEMCSPPVTEVPPPGTPHSPPPIRAL